MNRSVNKEAFFSYLKNHPAAIKKVIPLTEDIIIECIEKNPDCINFIPKDRHTENVLNVYLSKIDSYTARKYMGNNTDVLETLSVKLAEKFINNDPYGIKYFPQVSKELWLEVSKRPGFNIEFKNIPEKYLCEELLINIIRDCFKDFISDIPEKFWTDTLIKKALDTNGSYINKIKESVITREWVMYAFTTSAAKSRNIYAVKIPAKLWGREVAEVAARVVSLDAIPYRLRSKSVCLTSIYANQLFQIQRSIPKELLTDRDIQIAFIIKNKYDPDVIPNIKESAFQIEALQVAVNRYKENPIDPTTLIEHMQEFITEWIPILKLWPEAIAYIPKTDQTSEHILTALQNRAEEHDLNVIARSLNLTKITREMVPMLLNVEVAEIKDFIERKLSPPKRAEKASVVKDSYELIVDVTPDEFKNINARQKRNEDV